MLKRIVSGGQTDADRVALDVALEQGLEIGGWIPQARLAEDGSISHRFAGLLDTESADPSVRTVLNVCDSDATLIVSHGPLQGGSLLTTHLPESAIGQLPPPSRADPSRQGRTRYLLLGLDRLPDASDQLPPFQGET